MRAGSSPTIPQFQYLEIPLNHGEGSLPLGVPRLANLALLIKRFRQLDRRGFELSLCIPELSTEGGRSPDVHQLTDCQSRDPERPTPLLVESIEKIVHH